MFTDLTLSLSQISLVSTVLLLLTEMMENKTKVGINYNYHLNKKFECRAFTLHYSMVFLLLPKKNYLNTFTGVLC